MDQGPGMDPGLRQVLNKNDEVEVPFETESQEGMGLGLWICSTLLNKLSGRWQFNPGEQNRGLKVQFWFPPPISKDIRACLKFAQIGRQVPKGLVLKSENFKQNLRNCYLMNQEIAVLILDDNDAYRLEIEMILWQYGYKIWLSAGASIEVLNKLEKVGDKPDVMILDIRLKEKRNGISLAQELLHYKIPCIFFTAFPHEEQFLKAAQTHPSAYLLKPVKPLELHHAIQLAILNDEITTEEEEQEGQIGNLESLTLKDKNNIPRQIAIRKIFAVESFGNYLFFHTSKGRFHKKETLKSMEEQLAKFNFIRIHRQYMIAGDHWKKKLPLGEEVIVADTKFPIGRTYRKKLLLFLEADN